jgi:hypothetical protein
MSPAGMYGGFETMRSKLRRAVVSTAESAASRRRRRDGAASAGVDASATCGGSADDCDE